MPQWEYLTTFIEANAQPKEKREFLRLRFPERKRHPRYTPESMMPELDKLGAEGWELVHMEPVAQVGGKGDVLFKGSGSHWGHSYFCVFKRLKPEPVRPAQPAQPVQQPIQQQPVQHQQQQPAQPVQPTQPATTEK